MPKIKGMALERSWERLQELRDAGRLRPEDLEVALEAEDLELLEGKLEPSLWYPMAAYERMARLVIDVEAGGRVEAMERFGRDTAERLLASERFRTFFDGALRNGSRIGATLVQLAGMMMDFGRWHYAGESLREFQVVGEDVEALPELLRFGIQGFIAHLGGVAADVPLTVESERPEPGRVVFRARPAA